MPTDRIPDRSMRRSLSIALMVLGALLLMIMPAVLFFFAVTKAQSAHLPGTLVILSAAGGMAFILIGAALRD